MEYYIKYVTDITYKPELIPHHFRINRCYIESGGGLIRRRLRLRLTSLSFRKSSAH